MSRSPATAKKPACSPTLDFQSSDQPTRPLPTVTLFDLIAETRRMDAAAHPADDDRTVSIGPEENARLLASALALEAPRGNLPDFDDEPTLVAPSPSPSLCPSPPPTLELDLALPPAAGPPSGIRTRVASRLAIAARNDRGAVWLPKGATESYVVAGIWAIALSLIALLMVIVRSP